MKNDSNSLIYYLKAYPDRKNNIDFLFDLAILYLQNGVYNKAKKLLKEIKQLKPENK